MWMGYGYHGCIAFVSAQRAKTGNFKGFPHWSFFCDQAGGIRVDLCGGSFPDCGLPCAGSVLLWIFPVTLPEWPERGLLPVPQKRMGCSIILRVPHMSVGKRGAQRTDVVVCTVYVLAFAYGGNSGSGGGICSVRLLSLAQLQGIWWNHRRYCGLFSYLV